MQELGPASFFSELFGTIAGFTGAQLQNNPFPDIIPLNGQGGTLNMKDPGAVWLGLQLAQMQKKAYEFCYPLSSVVDRLAEADISGNMEIYNISGKGREKTAVNAWSNQMRKLLAQPNMLQTWDQFRGQQNIYKRIFGYCPVLPILPAGFENKPEYAIALINIPPWCFDVVPQNDYINVMTTNKLLVQYTVNILGRSFKLSADQVMILEDSFHQDENKGFLLPKSRLVGLDMAVSNLCAAMEADNVLLRKKGPLGFLSHDPPPDNVAGGAMPLAKEEKEELQADLARYGMSWSQFQFVISKMPMRWNPMSFNVSELGTKETILASARAICQRFGFPYVLFEDSDATYSNQASAHKKLYDDVVLPANARDMQKYDKFFRAKDANCYIECDYSHLGVFQEDELDKGRARAQMDLGLQMEYLNDVITLNEWRILQDMEPIPNGDLYYSQSPAAQMQNDLAQKKIEASQSASNAGNQLTNGK